MQGEIWTPEITSQSLYNKCVKLFDGLYPERGQFENILKIDLCDGEPHLIIAYNQFREQYHTAHSQNSGSSFDEDLDKRIIEINKKFTDYFFAVNKQPIVKGGILIVHNQNIPMTESDIESDFKTWAEIAIDTGLRIFANYPGAGASITNRQHAQAYPFRVPLEYFLQYVQNNTMVHYSGKNHVYTTDEIDGAVEKLKELKDANILFNRFIIGNYTGIVERQMSKEATLYFGGAPPSGSSVLGIIEVANKARFNELKETLFADDWASFEKVLIPKN